AELIYQAIETLNIRLLEILFDDDKVYCDMTKTLFCKKTERAFAEFKAAGDTCLVANSCMCLKKDGNYKVSRADFIPGYRFIGNRSWMYWDLAFKEIDGEIREIYYCDCREIGGKRRWTRGVHFRVFREDRADFTPSEEMLTIVKRCNIAVQEGEDLRVITLDDLRHLLGAYRERYGDDNVYLFARYQSLWPVRDLYQAFRLVSELPAKIPVFKRAVTDYRQLGVADEQSLIRWLIKY